MATTRYLVTATANYAEKVMSNLKSARTEADARAKGDRAECRVLTVATGRVSYVAEAPVSVEDFAALLAEVQAEREAQTPAKPVRATGRRAGLGEAAVTGWELLYDKPKQGCQVGRRDKSYALICTAHQHVRPLTKLVQERKLRKAGGWCPSCAH